MHDVLEGVCQYDLALLLEQFIFKDKRINLSLDNMNAIIQSFHYDINIKNKPVEILDTHVKKHCITMSAAEMHSLINNLNLMIGHLIPLENPFWELYLKLKKIVIIVTSKIIHINDSYLLESEIEEYMIMRKTLFPDNRRKSVKHHLLLHYPKVMRQVGPLGNTSAIRFESKHHEGKVAAHAAVSRVNVHHTIAFRQQLKFCYRVMTRNILTRLETGSKIVRAVNSFRPIVQKMLNNIKYYDEVECYKSVKRDNYIIQRNTVIMLPSQYNPEFYVIECITHDIEDRIVLICYKVNDFSYDNHFYAYNVNLANEEASDWTALQLNDLADSAHITSAKKCMSNTFINKTWI